MSDHVLSQLPALQAAVATDCQILHDPQDPEFQKRLARWTDIDRKVPAAIVLPRSEEDCLETVRWALKSSIPFVPKSGGHSPWSTIGVEGIVIDLTFYTGVHVNADGTATVVGGILAKQVSVCLAEAGLFTALGNGNSVGAIPYLLGGGGSITNSITGFGSDQILAARLITATGELVEVTKETQPDLLWGVKGAGQFFGLVTQLTVRTHPLTALRKQQGLIWVGAFIFPLDRATEVVPTMKQIMDDPTHATAGLMMAIAPPPARTPSLVISARYTGDEAPEVPFKALYDLQPIATTGRELPYQNVNDDREALCAKGDFKRFGLVGLDEFRVDAFVQAIEIWKKLVHECPDAINTTFNVQWDSRPVKAPEQDSAMSSHDIRYWQVNIVWHTDVKNRRKVDEYNEECVAVMRGPDETRYVDFQNATRTGPIQRRYRGEARLTRLRQLKQKWDAHGVFTRQLLN
ncbi:FAD-binding domain-containing protein [Aspergillus sclerotioniger CBS 115572]|uniref:FAD-binding domain-containing protein n=1 Tax=Aspergillus sclerotioniger CBS 115572 TaxID=1450535 RepID=A0A317VQ46_9EURO|nr:FAD-binding domain-containing protein [Aspergillus sclerotioniger CBS 115572]PWY76055.1 FAD-binding domain-containing protein [Aspergillus sclerotioniger CBS 115572]